ncbi:hypothetical protein [Methylosinus sp. LW4]|uniref:hypothetical protein n=1 Tax=Methylosinus sp. LW4 TaxID=136993 RepID=UPI00037A116E|nr:hypothetical protein [Methylosinus sp. LW4]
MPALAASFAKVVSDLDALLGLDLPDALRRPLERARRSAADARNIALSEARPPPAEPASSGDVRDMGEVA